MMPSRLLISASLFLAALFIPACGERADTPPPAGSTDASRPVPPPIGEGERTATTAPPPKTATGGTTAVPASQPGVAVGLTGDATALRLAAAEAYLAGYPIIETGRMAQALAKTRGFLHQHRPLNGAAMVVRTPDNDGAFSSVLVDVDGEPQVLTLPAATATLRLLVQVNDLTGRAVAVHRLLEPAAKAPVLVLAATDSTNEPAGFDRVIRIPTRCAIVSIRWLTTAADGPALAEAQGRCRVRGLREYKGWASLMSREAVAWPSYDAAAVADARALPLINSLLLLFPATSETVLRSHLARLSLDANRTWDATALDAGVRSALQAGIAEARQRIAAAQDAATGSGWQIAGLPADGDLTARAAAVAGGLGCADAQACLDASIAIDRDGQPLSGGKRYVLRFPAGQLPPTDGGWSLAAVDAITGLPDDDAKRRLVLTSRMSGLQYVADESLTIYIQHAPAGPEREANWLPVPEGRFRLCLHLPHPRDGLKDGSYRLPHVVPLEAPPMPQ